MKLVIIVLFFIATTANANGDVKKCQALVGTCDFYSCASVELGCDNSQYFINFGLHYCSKFDNEESHYTEHGKIFLQKVKTCLQEKLMQEESLTCESADVNSPAQHVACYKEANYCSLPPSDKFLIGITVLKKFLEDPRFQKSAWSILDCSSQADFNSTEL